MVRNLYYRVSPSPWPFMVSFCLLDSALGLVTWMSGDDTGLMFIGVGFLLLLCCVTLWWRDLLREGDQGYHTKKVVKNFRDGMAMFIVSEVMFFFSFFWAFFHSSLSPNIEVSGTWPPVGLRIPNAFGIPMVNTGILVLSGAFINYSLGSVRCRNYDHGGIAGLVMAILLSFIFLAIQYHEYQVNSFSMADGIYGSTFYMLTGFHGFHVLAGTMFMLVTLVRMWYGHFLSDRFFGLQACVWYWHFVDIVWIGVWVFFYVWGGGQIFDWWFDYNNGDVWYMRGRHS
uniref:Cytochrome c oxidase subunit 3 n=1 Tax=Brachidontes exustus TaxID=40254 RepID=A0A0U1V5X7_BRAEX|nr:cytochrome c oxidase subunit III [Brachidontes exustus]AIM58705.1 cytochrome c oxidase subunit III [Brachidontes exustus]